MPQAVDQRWVLEWREQRVWTGSNAEWAKWRVESRSQLQINEEGKAAERQREKQGWEWVTDNGVLNELKGEEWRTALWEGELSRVVSNLRNMIDTSGGK